MTLTQSLLHHQSAVEFSYNDSHHLEYLMSHSNGLDVTLPMTILFLYTVATEDAGISPPSSRNTSITSLNIPFSVFIFKT